MSLASFITPRRTLILDSKDKRNTLEELLSPLSEEVPGLNKTELQKRILEREKNITSYMGSGIAIPHVVIEDFDSTYIAVGLSKPGISWDPAKQDLVHLVILMIGGPGEHLQVLSEVASQLKDGELYTRLLDSTSQEDLYIRIAKPSSVSVPSRLYQGQDITRASFRKGVELAEDLDGAQIVLHADAFETVEQVQGIIGAHEVLIVTHKLDLYNDCNHIGLRAAISPLRGMHGSAQIQFVLLSLLSQEVISHSDIIVNISGPPSSGYLDSIQVTTLQNTFRFPNLFSESEAPPQLSHHILTRILQIAGELAAEGREGHAVGTLFVFGDHTNVIKYIRQMIANPFAGLKETDRNILDPNLEETIKEFAKIDGAFIIRDDGTLISAGTYLAGMPNSDELQPGLGARHTSAQGISAVTSAIAIAISESTRKISVYYKGKRLVVM
ncbi:MAG: diadenylate cyclase [Spirochaetota bacterium]